MQVSCGTKHTLFLDIFGIAFAAGSNKTGRMGISQEHRRGVQYSPIPVEIENRLQQVAAGDSHSLFLTQKEGLVFACGDNSLGQLGQDLSGEKLAFLSKPVQVKGLRYIKEILCRKYSMALANDGHLFMWGNGSLANYGLIPTRICSLPNKVSTISIGDSHMCATDEEGILWVWGKNKKGELGLGDSTPR